MNDSEGVVGASEFYFILFFYCGFFFFLFSLFLFYFYFFRVRETSFFFFNLWNNLGS